MACKKLSTISLADLAKRVPKNQQKQFEKFRDKTFEYHRRVNEYPEELPSIDWDYYRSNVRQDFVKMVDEFKIKYEEFANIYKCRHEIKDYSPYYVELEKRTEQVKIEIQEFVSKSNERIQVYENEIKRLHNLTPYEDMTLEEFVIQREDIADFMPRQGKALFWPHTPDEQIVEKSDEDRQLQKDTMITTEEKEKLNKDNENSKESKTSV